jgi:hypothetical protein
VIRALHARSARQSAVFSNQEIVAAATCRQVHSRAKDFLNEHNYCTGKNDEVAGFTRRFFAEIPMKKTMKNRGPTQLCPIKTLALRITSDYGRDVDSQIMHMVNHGTALIC